MLHVIPVLALLMKMMVKLVMVKLMMVVLVPADRLLLVKLGLQASRQGLVFLLLSQANHGLLLVTDDDLLRCC